MLTDIMNVFQCVFLYKNSVKQYEIVLTPKKSNYNDSKVVPPNRVIWHTSMILHLRQNNDSCDILEENDVIPLHNFLLKFNKIVI